MAFGIIANNPSSFLFSFVIIAMIASITDAAFKIRQKISNPTSAEVLRCQKTAYITSGITLRAMDIFEYDLELSMWHLLFRCSLRASSGTGMKE